MGNGTLIVRRVDDSDVGVYKCVGIGRTGPAQTYAAELLLACKSLHSVFPFNNPYFKVPVTPTNQLNLSVN